MALKPQESPVQDTSVVNNRVDFEFASRKTPSPADWSVGHVVDAPTIQLTAEIS